MMFFLAAFLISPPAPAAPAPMGVTARNLRCEHLEDVPVIDAARPVLGWIVSSDERGQTQTAYRILVASSADRLEPGKVDLWDSGRIDSARSIDVAYDGEPLEAGMRCFWKVRLWDKNGREGPWSRTAEWEMGLIRPTDWKGQWIGDGKNTPKKDRDFYKDDPAPLFRKSFKIEKPIKRARLYISGLGYYEARLNGERIGDHLLDPGWTDYAERVYYSTYDITAGLGKGLNAIGVTLGNGWYNPLPLRMWGNLNLREHLPVGRPRFIAQLNIEYVDGTRRAIVTDESWRVTDGPLLRNNVYLGEVYDARREVAGWDRPGCDDGGWNRASIAAGPPGPLEAQPLPPIRNTKIVRPISITEPEPDVYVFDLGQNFAGWARLRVEGPAGTRVNMRFGELLHKDGTVNTMTSVCGQIKREGVGGAGAPAVAEQSDTYILKGDGLEVHTPRFTFHGFRYVQITGYPGVPGKDAIEGLILNTDVEPAGYFECSNPLFNRIQENCVRSFLSNIFSVQSDCPHREKFCYGGDAVAVSEAYMYNFDMSAFYAKMVRDFDDAKRSNGGLTETAPHVGISAAGFGDRSGPIAWGSAHPILQEQLYRYYGNERLIEEQYETALEWARLIRSSSEKNDYIIGRGLSDYESVAPKPVAVTSTAFHYLNAQLLSRFAQLLGKEDQSREHAAWAQAVKESFVGHFLPAGDGRVGPHTQAAQAFGLYHDLVPAEQREAAVDVLLNRIEERDGHLSTGFFGTKYMLDVLSRTGHADVAYRIVNQETAPGWGYEILEHDATTLWEHWFFSDGFYSHNHPAFGSVSEWFYKSLAGINSAPEAVGFDEIVIRPRVVEQLDWVKAHYDSVRGRIASEWERREDRLELKVTIPANTTAEVYIPTADAGKITENGKMVGEVEGVEFLKMEEGAAVFRIGSGSYKFASPLF